MSNKKEAADIKEEWGFMLRNSTSASSIPVVGGWLQGAMPQLFEHISNIELELETVIGEKALMKMSLKDIEEAVTGLEEERNDLVQHNDSLKVELDEAKAQ
jgi:hypothetical protein|tara:strand:- start:1824 stop:2126 length:303 start_codon:yes stop_codon:yes gene_type:complete